MTMRKFRFQWWVAAIGTTVVCGTAVALQTFTNHIDINSPGAGTVSFLFMEGHKTIVANGGAKTLIYGDTQNRYGWNSRFIADADASLESWSSESSITVTADGDVVVRLGD